MNECRKEYQKTIITNNPIIIEKMVCDILALGIILCNKGGIIRRVPSLEKNETKMVKLSASIKQNT